jgi:putative phage-type endonuclease
MNAVANAQPDQRSAEWYEGRKGRITASRVGSILGLSKYKTRAEVLREMVREHFDAPREFVGNEATEYGQAHEADALNAYEQRFAVMVEPCGLIPHPVHDFLAASPDGLVGEHGLVECKCPFRSRYTTPSAEYIAQMQLQMACTDRDWCDFVIWREGEPVIVERVNRDPDWLTSNVGALANFMLDYDDACASKEAASPYLADKDRDDETWRNLVAEWRDAKRHADEAAEWEKRSRADLIGLAPQGAKGCGITVSRVETEGRIDYKRAITQMLPDVDLSPFKSNPSVSYRITESKA